MDERAEIHFRKEAVFSQAYVPKVRIPCCCCVVLVCIYICTNILIIEKQRMHAWYHDMQHKRQQQHGRVLDGSPITPIRNALVS